MRPLAGVGVGIVDALEMARKLIVRFHAAENDNGCLNHRILRPVAIDAADAEVKTEHRAFFPLPCPDPFAQIWTGANEIMSAMIQHDLYGEFHAERGSRRDFERDAMHGDAMERIFDDDDMWRVDDAGKWGRAGSRRCNRVSASPRGQVGRIPTPARCGTVLVVRRCAYFSIAPDRQRVSSARA
jgi:hypothetical protein